jgi:hypothetical protein
MMKRLIAKWLYSASEEWLDFGEKNLRHALISLINEETENQWQIWFHTSSKTISIDRNHTKIYKQYDPKITYVTTQDYGISLIPIITFIPYYISLVKPSHNTVMIQIYKHEHRDAIPKCNLDDLHIYYKNQYNKKFSVDQIRGDGSSLHPFIEFWRSIQYNWYSFDSNKRTSINQIRNFIKYNSNKLIPLDRTDLINEYFEEKFPKCPK